LGIGARDRGLEADGVLFLTARKDPIVTLWQTKVARDRPGRFRAGNGLDLRERRTRSPTSRPEFALNSRRRSTDTRKPDASDNYLDAGSGATSGVPRTTRLRTRRRAAVAGLRFWPVLAVIVLVDDRPIDGRR
jgi:hypothetical protein